MSQLIRPSHRRFLHKRFDTCSLFLARNKRISSLSIEDEKVVDRLAHGILGRHKRIDGVGGYMKSSQVMMRQRIALSKSITMVESKSPKRRMMADSLLHGLMKSSSSSTPKSSFRLGLGGSPGAGKSSLVERLGLYVLGLDEKEQKDAFCPQKVAVLAIDPSSHISGGSIMGDKTRMSQLSCHPNAYVRPSPSSGVLGGLAAYTYDAASLCEYANFDLTIIETVGVGQSEIELAECCDLFLLLLPPGGGDELQGSKKGIVEVADVLVVNKADGELKDVARKTANEYKKAVGLLRKPAGWWGSGEHDDECSATFSPPVILVSAKTGFGIPELWALIQTYRDLGTSNGYIDQKRRKQRHYWLTKYLREHVLEAAANDDVARQRKKEIESDLDNGLILPRIAASQLWQILSSRSRNE